MTARKVLARELTASDVPTCAMLPQQRLSVAFNRVYLGVKCLSHPHEAGVCLGVQTGAEVHVGAWLSVRKPGGKKSGWKVHLKLSKFAIRASKPALRV